MDIDHYFSGDIATLPTDGELMTSNGVTEGQQRLLRRILTNPGDYIQQPDYGVGAPRYVGASTAELDELRSRIIEAIAAEDSVAALTPAPIITVSTTREVLTCTIQYVDVSTQTAQVLSFTTGGV